MTDNSPHGYDVRTLVAAWLLVVLVAIGLIAATGYQSPDHDSTLHAGISARLSEQPVGQWIAPEWWGFWTLHGPYCEHPVGIFVPPAALARLGYPSAQAAYAVNAVYQAACFVLIVVIARTVVPASEAHALGWLLQLIPIAFVFRIRANHEYAVLAGLLLAVYATERSRRKVAWVAGIVAGFCLVLLVKGVFALIVPVACAVWLIARADRPADVLRPWGPWAVVVALPVIGALVAWGYEAAYQQATGRSFLAVYRARQVPEGALTTGSPVFRTAYNAFWYACRIIWYAFPWSLFAGSVLVRAVRRKDVGPWEQGGTVDSARVRAGAWFAIVTGVVLTAGFSIAHRKADRYLFPVYFILGAVGALAAVRRFPRFARLVDRCDRPWVPAACFLVLFLVHLATLGKLPILTFWRS
jgi:4-amino-4-deoxy-L-arabinose transferase-like glycosyltransferase